MTDDVRRLMTGEQRALLETAKERGGICGACGQTLGPEDVVWIELVWVGMKLFRDPTHKNARVFWDAPVGVECASPSFVARKADEEPEPCCGCGRGVYFDAERGNRGPICCSRKCRARFHARKFR